MEIFIIKVLNENNVTEEEMKAKLLDSLYKLQEVEMDASEFSKLPDEEILKLRHCLSCIEEEYEEDFPEAIRNLWEKFFFLEKFRELQLN